MRFAKTLNIFLSFTFIIFIGSCTLTKNKNSANDKAVTSENEIISSLKKKNIDFDNFILSADAIYSSQETYSFSLEIRMKKDSFIWFNVKKFGIEVARGLIKPDSCYILDRINTSCYIRSMQDLKNEYNIPIDFNELQQVIAGNILIDKNIQVVGSGKEFRLESKNERYSSKIGLDEDTNPVQIYYSDLCGNKIELHYSSFMVKNSLHYSDEIDYTFSSNNIEKNKINLKNRNITIDKISTYKFSIPVNYEKK